jgi:hypothetical protein
MRVSRWALLVAIAAAVVVLLFTVVFPWVDRTFVNDPVLSHWTAATIPSADVVSG